MGSVGELKEAVKDALQRKGLLPQLQANVRSQIFSVLLAAEDEPRPEPCDETLVINELIREYLVFNGLRDTLSVFIPESGQPAVRPFDRDFLAKKLRVQETPQSQQVPLLYHLVARQQQQQLPSAGPGQQQQQHAAACSDAGSHEAQHQRQTPGGSPAGRLLPPARQQREHKAALKDIDTRFSDLHSLSSMSQSTQGS